MLNDGSYYEGYVDEDCKLPHGIGTQVKLTGSMYEGQFMNGVPNG